MSGGRKNDILVYGWLNAASINPNTNIAEVAFGIEHSTMCMAHFNVEKYFILKGKILMKFMMKNLSNLIFFSWSLSTKDETRHVILWNDVSNEPF